MSEQSRVAVINLESGLVENVASVTEGDGSTAPDGFQFIQSEQADIGDTWDGAQIVKYAPVEAEISADISAISIGRLEVPTTSDRLDALESRVAAMEAALATKQ